MIWRIRDRDAFRRLQADGRRARAGVLWCTFLHDPSASPPRVAFAIGRAVGPAVTRNTARRRLRALLQQLDWPPGWYLIGARPAIAERPFDALRRDLTSIRASVLATPSISTATSSPAQAGGSAAPSDG